MGEEVGKEAGRIKGDGEGNALNPFLCLHLSHLTSSDAPQPDTLPRHTPRPSTSQTHLARLMVGESDPILDPSSGRPVDFGLVPLGGGAGDGGAGGAGDGSLSYDQLHQVNRVRICCHPCRCMWV